MPIFDASHAFQYLITQCEFGPRVPGTPAHRDCLAFLTKELQNFGARVSHQPFLQNLPRTDQSVTLTNVIASFGLEKGERVLLCAHWDSRPWADEDGEPANHSRPVPGANDGAS
ncbi:MAG TPA: M28 family peptidase, partial [bacterium]